MTSLFYLIIMNIPVCIYTILNYVHVKGAVSDLMRSVQKYANDCI